ISHCFLPRQAEQCTAVATALADAEELPKIPEEDMEALKAAVWKGNLTEAAAKAKEALVRADKIPLNIAVTGVAGSGKSSFVNAIRGLGDTDYSSAAIGITETTMESTAYPHPRYPDVIFCDLPGIGTPAFKSDTYLEQVTFSHYDFFIIISSPRLTCHDISLAQEIQRLGKKFYFVHSKVDLDLTNEKQNGDKEGTLKWRNCIKDLKEAGVASTQVFLISKWDLGKYDFPKLQKVLVDELPSHKRHACLQSLSNIVKETLKKKKEQLQTQIWLKSLASCLSLICDVAILVFHMKRYCLAFGLDEESLTRLAKQIDKPVAELKSAIRNSPLASAITKEFILSLLSRSLCGALMVVELILNFVPGKTNWDGAGL
uniref:IRG-type G domain-containing protein n=1 Tax=Gopherus evgoodei TaxID=1825980 RepID=A0A8C4YRF8_9SAUR